MVLGAVRQEAGPWERWPEALKIKLAQGGLSGTSLPRSGGSCDGQAGGWTALTVAKDTEERVGKQLQEAKGPNPKQAWLQPKKGQLTVLFLSVL